MRRAAWTSWSLPDPLDAGAGQRLRGMGVRGGPAGLSRRRSRRGAGGPDPRRAGQTPRGGRVRAGVTHGCSRDSRHQGRRAGADRVHGARVRPRPARAGLRAGGRGAAGAGPRAGAEDARGFARLRRQRGGAGAGRGELDLKALAAAAGAKRAAMAEPAAAERATGYVVGGISPLGQRRRLATFVDSSLGVDGPVYVSAGRRGLARDGGGPGRGAHGARSPRRQRAGGDRRPGGLLRPRAFPPPRAPAPATRSRG